MTRHNFPMLLREFRDYVCKYAKVWHVDGQGHHHPIWSRVATALDDVGLNDDTPAPSRHEVVITLDTVAAVAELTAAYHRLLIHKLQTAAIRRGHVVRLGIAPGGIEIIHRVAPVTIGLIPWTEVDATDLVKAIDDALEASPFPEDGRQCRVCGCTTVDCSGCIERTGAPCYWVALDLCSACLPTPAPGDFTIDATEAIKRADEATAAIIADNEAAWRETEIRCPNSSETACTFPDCTCHRTTP